jgi:hypothetical protein
MSPRPWRVTRAPYPPRSPRNLAHMVHVDGSLRSLLRVVVAALAVGLLAPAALAHQTVTVGDGPDRFDLVVGFTREPVFTDERNALDLVVRRSVDRAPIEGLARSLGVEIIAPDGVAVHAFTLRDQYGRPGAYTDDVMLGVPGVYTIRVRGFVGDVEVDETFQTHEVRPLASLRFP